MQTRLSAIISRVVAYWTWWRLLLLVSAVAAAAIAAVSDNAAVAVVAVAAAALPPAILLALLGDRVAAHHRTLAAGPPDPPPAVEAPHPEPAAPSAPLPPGRLSVLIAPGPTDQQLLDVLREVHAVVPTAECLVALTDVGQDAATVRSLVPLMREWPTLGCRRVAAGASVFDELIDIATGRCVLTIEVGRTTIDHETLVALASAVPGPDEPWVGMRRTGALAVLGRTAVVECGGLAAGELEGRLIAGGYVVDDHERPARPAVAPVGGRMRAVPAPAQPLEAGAGRGRVLLVPMASYHTEELFPLAQALSRRGVQSVVAVPSPWVTEIAPAILATDLAVYDLPAPGGWLADVAAVVVLNDWDAEVGEIIATAQRYGVATIAKVEGVQDFADVDVPLDRRAYRHADHVLCQGRNDVQALADRPTTIVGNSRLEQLWLAPPRPEPMTPLAVINVNFTFGVLEEQRDLYVATAIEGCRQAGIDALLSVHPHDRGSFENLPRANEPVGRLLERATVLISRFSTVPFEAMARGVPFVYHNPHGEQVPHFADPAGAFETSTDAASLTMAIEASARSGRYRDRCEPFFAAQVDIDPEWSSAQRAAEAVSGLCGGTAS